jgi:hypothetical protein
MNRLIVIIILTVFTLQKAKPQSFGALSYLGNGSAPYYIEKVLTDSVHNTLLISSKWLKYAGGKKVRGICSWNGFGWDSLAGGINTHDKLNVFPNGNVLCSVAFGSKLLVGGNFESIGGIQATALATWNGSNWDSLPVRAFKFLDYGASIYSFANYNNKLYIGGYFDTIQDQPANGLAVYDGVSFQPVSVPLSSQAGVLDMKVFNGCLYICGVFTYSNQPGDENILSYNGTNWSSVGGGVRGNTSSLATMEIYNNTLYAGGYFVKADGNIADIIMKWDGANWSDANWGDEYLNGSILKLLKYHNKLYAFGSFTKAANKKGSRIAVSDGLTWCTFSDTLDEKILSASIFRDSIYIGGAFRTIDGDTTMRCVAKLTMPFNYNNCSLIDNIQSNKVLNGLSFFPNPTQGKINIVGDRKLTDKLIIEVENIYGNAIYKNSLSQIGSAIDLTSRSPGVYFIRLIGTEGQKVWKIIKE